MEPSGSQQLEQPLLIKREPVEEEPNWPAAGVDPGPDPLATPVQPEPGAPPMKTEALDPLAPPVQPEPGAPAIKTEAGWPGGAEQAARAGAGPGRWLAAVRLSAADRAAAEAQLPRQQSPALAPVKEEALIDPKLEFADLTDSSGDSDAEPGAQSPSEKDWEPPEPQRRTRGLGGPGAERSCQLQQHAAAQHPGSTARSCPDHGQTSAQHPKDKPLRCRQCGKGFACQSKLQMHERVHSGDRPFVCPDCGAGFKRKEHLQLHSRTHSGEKPHRCAQCGRGFAVLSSLRVHERTHTGARPYACPDCGQRFAREHSLRIHALTHSGAQPHVCEVCGRRFSQIGNLRRHSRIHTGQKPFSCGSCGRSFRQKGTLKKHVRIHLRELGPVPDRPSALQD